MAEAQRQLSLTLSSAGIAGTWDWDIPEKRLHVDGRFAALTGLAPPARPGTVPLSPGPLPASDFFTGIHPLDRMRVRLAVSGILGGAEVFDKEYRLLGPDGSVRWVHARGRCHFGSEGRPARFTGVLVEITEQKRVEERLRIAQSAGRVGAFEHVPGFATVAASPQFCSLLGLVPSRTVAASAVNALVVEGDPPLMAPDQRQEGELPPIETRVRLADSGEVRWLVRRGEAIRDTETSGLRHVGVIYDVTDSKRAEVALRELNDTLEARVREAVAERERAEEQLRQSQKMEAVGQLTGGIAHDFNNLLAVITGSLELVQRRIARGDTDVGRFIAGALDGTDRAAKLTHRLLAFARQQPLEPRPTDPNRLVAGMVDLLRRTLGETVKVETRLMADPPPIFVDQNQLENAILNLAVNARDAMPGGGRLVLEIAPGSLEDGIQGVSITVRDTGTGMPPEVVARAFEPFFTTKPQGRGTGLGLSQVYGFVTQSGGRVRIDSQPGQGTAITLTLPVSRDGLPVEDAGRARLAAPSPGRARR
ncbi:histidine kinase, partial [Methylobacterium indicum]